MSDDPEIILTEDGSYSLFSPQFGASFHSRHGALQETEHVYIQAGLSKVASAKTSIDILDIGFGTGLNALCSLRFGIAHHLNIRYTGVDYFAVNPEILAQLDFQTAFAKTPTLLPFINSVHDQAWDSQQEIAQGFLLHKRRERFEDINDQAAFDLVYYDAFAPDVQPELWNQERFTAMYMALREGGILVSYCAKGQVRRDLQAAGFKVERLPGPPGKREMLRATR